MLFCFTEVRFYIWALPSLYNLLERSYITTHNQSVSVLDDVIFDKFGEKWDRTITSLANLLDVPVAIIFKREQDDIRVISTNDHERNPFRHNDTIPIEGSFCNYVFQSDSKFKVADYRNIDLDIDNVATQSDFISYLGFPLTWPNGENFGTICLLDDTRNYYSGATEEFLENFRDMLNDSLRLIDVNYGLQRKADTMQQQLEEPQDTDGLVPVCPSCKHVQFNGHWVHINEFLSMDTADLTQQTLSSWSTHHRCVN